MTHSRPASPRRNLLKLLAAAPAAVALARSLPERWSTPVVSQAVLPAHAQTTALDELPTCRVGARANRTTGPSTFDLELVPDSVGYRISGAIAVQFSIPCAGVPVMYYLVQGAIQIPFNPDLSTPTCAAFRPSMFSDGPSNGASSGSGSLFVDEESDLEPGPATLIAELSGGVPRCSASIELILDD